MDELEKLIERFREIVEAAELMGGNLVRPEFRQALAALEAVREWNVAAKDAKTGEALFCCSPELNKRINQSIKEAGNE